MKWDLVSAVCLERLPTITPLPTPIEKEMLDMLEKLERINSLKSDHELWQEKDKKLAKNKKAGKSVWTLPQSCWENGETLRQTAERALKDNIDNNNVRILGNAPWGVHTIKYSASQRVKLGTLGTKIFFYKAQLLNKECIPSSTCEYNWLGREELATFLQPDFHHSVSQFIIDED